MGLKDNVSDMQLLLTFRSKVQPLYSHQKDLGRSSHKAVNTFSKTELKEEEYDAFL